MEYTCQVHMRWSSISLCAYIPYHLIYPAKVGTLLAKSFSKELLAKGP